MRTASILLALVFVLGFVSEVGAQTAISETICEYEISLGGQALGIGDYRWNHEITSGTPTAKWTLLHLGRLGRYKVPFTATQGLVGFCVITGLLVIVPAVLTVRWKRKRSNLV